MLAVMASSEGAADSFGSMPCLLPFFQLQGRLGRLFRPSEETLRTAATAGSTLNGCPPSVRQLLVDHPHSDNFTACHLKLHCLSHLASFPAAIQKLDLGAPRS